MLVGRKKLAGVMVVFALFAGMLPLTSVTATVTDRDIAARFAPILYQAIGDKPRGDYITNFDFDGDWRGDNNWKDAENKKFPLLGYVYYAVSETQTHYFIHYAVFHPRDYKGGSKKGVILSTLINEGTKGITDQDPTGLVAEATAAHENDMEGALVVAAKGKGGLDASKVVYVETLHHNTFTPYYLDSTAGAANVFKADGQHPMLFVEAKGHGIEAFAADDKRNGENENIIYKFTGKAGDPETRTEGTVGYDLLPIATTLWPKAQVVDNSTTYGAFHDYGSFTINLLQPNGSVAAKQVKVGNLASAFLGKTGGVNMARPPWGWFSNNERKDPLGLWFFDPAKVVKRDFKQDDGFSTAYTRLPFWAVN